MLNLDIACNRNRKDANGDYPTDFFSVVLWGKTAEIVSEHFDKGDSIIVSGRMESRKYEDKNGNKRTAWELQADGFDFCGPKSSGSKADNSSAPASAPADEPAADDSESEVPF